jgi:hypothetical protein
MPIAGIAAAVLMLSGAQAEKPPNPELSFLASEYDGKSAEVRCIVTSPTLYGIADIEQGRVWIKSWFCNPMLLVSHGIYTYPGRAGVGISTLAHEATHLTGVLNEARTECIAYQETDDLARIFGVDKAHMPLILHFAYKDHFIFIREAPQYNNPKKCKQDGAWDKTPYDGRWP